MPGYFTNGMPLLGVPTGNETFPADTNLPNGESPQSGAFTGAQLAAYVLFYQNRTDITPSNGARWYVSASVGATMDITGISVLVGATGGTDKLIAELHDSTGALLATSATAGVTCGTAGTWQQLPFTSVYQAAPGDYFVAIQVNGNTCRIAAYNAPTSPLLTGTAAGTFGTGASITPPTTYTAGDGPVTLFY